MPPKLEFNNSDYWSDPNTTSKYSFADGTTGPPCLLLLQQAGLAPSTGKEDLVIIDQACGGGITSQLLWETLGDEGKRNTTLKCGDFSEGMVASAKSRMDRLGWGEKGSAEVIDAMDTKLPSDHFTHVIMNFGINVVPDSDAALKECIRILRPNGTLALTTWSHLGWVHPVTSAFAAIPSCPAYPDSYAFLTKLQSAPWNEPSYIRSTLLSHAALDASSLEINEHKTPSTGENGEVWARGISWFVNSTLGKVWGEEEGKKWTADKVESVLRDWMEKEYGKGEKITLEMGAFTITVKKRA